MRHRDTNENADQLRNDVAGHVVPSKTASAASQSVTTGWKMSSGDGGERKNQCNEARSRGNSVCQKRQRDGTSSEPLGHDAGTDHGREPSVDGSKPATTSSVRDLGYLRRRRFGSQVGVSFGAPSSRPKFEDVGVM